MPFFMSLITMRNTTIHPGLLAQHGKFVGRKSHNFRSALVGAEGVSVCALVAGPCEGQEYWMVHIFEMTARELSSRGPSVFDGGDYDEYRLYSWSHLIEFLAKLDSARDELCDIERKERRHRLPGTL